MVKSMKPGSVIVDLAAEQGGNCELTEPGEVVVRHGVTIIGYTDLPSRLAKQSSTLYATNLFRLTEELCKTKDGVINVNMEDEVIRGLTVIKDGESPGRRRRRSSPRRRPRRPPPSRPRARQEGHGHGGRRADGGGPRRGHVRRRRRCCSCSSARYAPAGLPRALHRVRAGLLRGLHGRLERDARAAHAADERDQRDQRHHRDRRAGAGRAARRGRGADRSRPVGWILGLAVAGSCWRPSTSSAASR